MLKKISVIFLVSLLIVNLSACTKKPKEDDETSSKKTMVAGINDGAILPEIYEDDYSPYRADYGFGTCTNLKGNPTVIAVFMDDDESSWDARAANGFINNYLKPALRYLEDKAEEWGVELKFNLKCFATALGEYEFKYNGIAKYGEDDDRMMEGLLEQVSNDLGYSSEWAMYSDYKYKSVDDNDVIFLTFLNKKGISHGNNNNYIPNLDWVENSVVFSEYLHDNTVNRSATIIRVLLFLFGANNIDTDDYPPEYSEKYENDIMNYTFKKLYDHEITDLTAFRVGWTDEIPEVLKE